MSIIDKFTTPKGEGIDFFMKYSINSLKFRMWKDDGYKVMRSCTAAPISTGVALSQVRDLFCLIKDLCETVGDLWRVHLAVSGRAGKVNHSCWKSPNMYREDAFYARTYIQLLFPKKTFTLSHGACSLLIFNGFECEGLDFKAFTQTVPCGERSWRAEESSLHTGKSLKIRRKSA